MVEYTLTGSSGFLGRIFRSELHGSIQTIGRSDTCDIKCDLSKDVPVLKSSRIVIHAAGKAHVIPRTEDEKQEFFNVNVEGTKHLIQGIEQSDELPRAILFISSASVYGEVDSLSEEEREMITEEGPLHGDTPYAKSKIEAEKFLLDWGLKNRVNIGILRLPLLVGPDSRGNLNSMINGIRSGKYFRIGKGKARKSMVWAADIPAVFESLSHTTGIYNLTDGTHPSFYQIEEELAKLLGKKVRTLPAWLAQCAGWFGDLVGPRFPLNSLRYKKITNSMTLDDAKARIELGWDPSQVTEKLEQIV